MANFLRRRWRERPPGALAIDWSHPLASGLAVHVDASVAHDIVRGGALAMVGTKLRPIIQGGGTSSFLLNAFHDKPSLGRGFGVKYGSGAADELGPYTIPDLLGDLTVVWTCMQYAADIGGGFGRVLDVATTAGSSLRAYNSGSGIWELDRPFTVAENTTAPSSVQIAPEGIYQTQVVSLRADGAGGAVLWYVDGKPIGLSSTSGSGTPAGFAGGLYVGNRADAARNWGGVIESVAFFTKQWGQGEAAAYAENRWQYMRRPRATLYFLGNPSAAAITYQYSRPSSDVSAGGWLPSSGSDLFPMVGESVRDDATYIYSPSNPTTQQFELALSTLAGPLSAPMDISLVLQAMNLDTGFDFDLVEGSTIRDSWSESVTVAAGAVERIHTFTSGVIASISDGSNLRIRGVAHG